ncbi:MAG: PQQ-binding-like beta-propeller repeat protein [Planctomycetota bacterium]
MPHKNTLQTISLASVGLALLIAGCSSSGGGSSSTSASPNTEARRAAFPIVDEDFAKLGYRRDWVGFPAISSGGKIIHLAVYPDIVAVVESGSRVTVLETSTGQRRWANEIANSLTRFTGLSRIEGRILASSDSEAFGLRIDNGAIDLRQTYDRVVNTGPIIVGDVAIYGTASGEILAHSLGLGLKRWAFGTSAGINHDPVAVDNSLAFVNQAGEVFFLSSTGQVMGRSKAMFGPPAKQPVSTGTLLVAGSNDQSIYAFRPGESRPVWQYRTSSPIRTAPIYYNATIYCEVEGSLTAFEAKTGTVKWKAKGVTGEVVAVRKGDLLVFDGTKITLVDNGRGETIHTIPLDTASKIVTDSFADGNLYIASKSGLIAKFLPR